MADHIDDLRGCLDWHYDNIKNLQFERLCQEQHSKKASFRIFDVAENEGENVEDIRSSGSTPVLIQKMVDTYFSILSPSPYRVWCKLDKRVL